MRSLRKKTVDPAIVSAAGYDRAVKATPVDDFMQVWAMRKSGRVIDMWQYTANKDSVALA